MPSLAKIEFRTDDGEVETLWAEHLGGSRYQLDNSPFYAYGVSWRDIVEARPADARGFPVFERVVEKSGHRTIRLILKPPADQSPESQAILDELVSLGCSYEGANPGYLSVDLPPSADLKAVCQYLISTEQQWEHADPTYSDLYDA